MLQETLEMHREMLRLASDKYTGLLPKKGMEQQFEDERKKCDVLMGLMIGLQSENVRREMAQWQKDRMEEGCPPQRLTF